MIDWTYVIIGCLSVVVGQLVMSILRPLIPFRFIRLLIAIAVVVILTYLYATRVVSA